MLSAEELMQQSRMTAHDAMSHAVVDIDSIFGEGYAKANPALVAAYMQTSALDFLAAFGLQGIAESIDRVSEALEK